MQAGVNETEKAGCTQLFKSNVEYSSAFQDFLASGSKPKNEHKEPFDSQTRGARTSGPRKDGFLKALRDTHEHATCIMEQYKSTMRRMNIQ
jgi:hypothetical protein